MNIFDDPFDFNHDGNVNGMEMAMAYEFFLKDDSDSRRSSDWTEEEEEDFLDDMDMMDDMEEW